MVRFTTRSIRFVNHLVYNYCKRKHMECSGIGFRRRCGWVYVVNRYTASEKGL